MIEPDEANLNTEKIYAHSRRVEMLQAYIDGEKVKDIALRHRVHWSTGVCHAKKFGLRRLKHLELDEAKVISAYKRGTPRTKICSRFKINESTLTRLLKRRKVPLRNR